MNKPAQPISDEMLIQKYFEIKDAVEAEQKAFKAKIQPELDKLELIENAFLERLNNRGAKNTKTEFGTAYKAPRLDVKVVDRTEFLKFCFDQWDKWGSDMLNAKAVTEHVRAYVEQHDMKEYPPGITGETHIRVNIRRG